MKRNNKLTTLLGIAAVGITPIGSCERQGPKESIEDLILKGIYDSEDQYIGPTISVKDEKGNPQYIRFDLYRNPRSFREYREGANPPADIIVLSDLREIENADQINNSLYANMIMKGDIPAHIITTSEIWAELQRDPSFEKRVRSRVSDKYDILIMNKSRLREEDPWNYISEKESPKGVYTGPQVK